MKVVLASASPRRHELLKEIFAEFEIHPAAADEDFIGSTPEATVKEIASRKIVGIKGDLVIGCDTVVYLDGEYYHKPADRKAAINMLAALSGKTHEVYSGLTVAYKGKIYKESEKSEVIFKELTPEGIAQYVDTFLPFDKAGAYGIQDEYPVAGYRGSYTNIMGLPLEKLKELLARIGVTNG